MKHIIKAAALLILLVSCQTAEINVSDLPGAGPLVKPEFTWDNATVYFVMVDRFYNGDPSNDFSYGRFQDGKDEVGTFHGGDLAGLTMKIEEGYFTNLGIDALWISSPLEQIHGWVGGGNGAFAHFAYHGYYPMDFTQIDKNMGSEEDFARFVETAHANGIRVVLDVVMNHAGYHTIKDMNDFGFGAWKDEPLPDSWLPSNGNYHSYHDFIDYNGGQDGWAQWWGADWIRAGLPGYKAGGGNKLTESVGFLPDFYTESTKPVELPPFLLEKAARGESRVEPRDGYTVRDYLIEWLSYWVREYGIDGFRIDTAIHVEMDGWKELEAAASEALAQWKAENPDKALDDLEFWMTGEAWGQGLSKNSFFDNGFDSLINFDFQSAADSAVSDFSLLDSLYSNYAAAINSDPDFNLLSYISSHDTVLFYNTKILNNGYRVNGRAASPERQKNAGTVLLLAPGAVQIFYGDEVAREYIPYKVGDNGQGTRTPFPWENAGSDIHAHWQKIGQFRRNHPAVGAGAHQTIDVKGAEFAFVRKYYDVDEVLVALGVEGSITIPVAGLWEDGTLLRDAYSGAEALVEKGKVRFTADSNGVLLLERK
jgi:alpha-amylase